MYTQDKWTVTRMTCARIPTVDGEFQLYLYDNNQDHKEHLALVLGQVTSKRDVLVRVHSECFTGDVLGSRRCDCGEQLHLALRLIAEAGSGIIIYLRQEGRGIGLPEKLRAYNLQDQGYDTVDANLLLGHQADGRDYTVAARILDDLGVGSIQLMTNNPSKIESLEHLGTEVTARIPLQTAPNPDNASYLRAKAERMRHLLVLNQFSHGLSCPSPFQEAMMRQIEMVLAQAPDYHQRAGRPLVTLSYAQSLDGSIAARPGSPLPLSGSHSLALTHSLRAAHDAILVGIGTVLADNPRLSVRLVTGKDPQPVVVDSHLRTPLRAHLLQNGALSPWIATTEGADTKRQAALEALGARILRLPTQQATGRVDLPALLERLGELGITSLMVEGGAQIITSFLAARLVNQLVLTIAPVLVGGLHVMGPLGQAALLAFPRLRNLNSQRFGPDLVLRGDVDWGVE